ncbi:N-6 DNA methylase [Polyangium jinanense]|uniref:type ISP restriction/modification enzyme n=1 Tax=Polyangium jinanense TaxID=2829994 RepID=UPI002341899C|nr:type ISP restriction/modification enzyme [Polyangium jinanense]MDC3962529.1 N-6 DNA methylase [Polyangium jinanense]
MPLLKLAPNHKTVVEYYNELQQLSFLHKTHEGAVRGAFQNLLGKCAKQFNWTVVGEYEIKRPKRPSLRVDGALVDPWTLTHGYWEAKDEKDDLKVEVKKKIALGYPTDNILFQSPDRIILVQNGKQVLDNSIKDLKEAPALVEALKEFFRYRPPAYDQWEQAVEEFRTKVPEFADALLKRIHGERTLNSVFAKSFTGFVDVCRRAINPNLSEQAVEEMLIQHMLTERIFRKVFDNPDFAHRNAIAAEIEKVINALTARAISREKFLAGLDRFYGAIETTASTIESFTEKQHFLNTVYEKFFQGFSVKVADTHGIVYTPQPIVKFMVRSVDEILKREFGKSLGSRGVHVLDPFVGTGNFMLHVMRQIPRTLLAYKYEHELHANEVMLLPYYIAAMNIEHEYAEMMGEYKPFDGLCLADTFELAEDKHPSLFTEQNTARVERQRKLPIFVVCGNPPYNANQVNENDNNKNRYYPVLDTRVAATYGKASRAKLKNKLRDPYVKAIRWATDRIGDNGIVAFVTNGSFIDDHSLDGLRKCVVEDFDAVYVLDLGGRVRNNSKISGTTHNVFGVQVRVSVNFFVRRSTGGTARTAKVFYARTPELARKQEKYDALEGWGTIHGVEWTEIQPDRRHRWLQDGAVGDFADFTPMFRETSGEEGSSGIFENWSLGVSTNRDSVVYDFDRQCASHRVADFVADYNVEMLRYQENGRPRNVDAFLNTTRVKWSESLKRSLERGTRLVFDQALIVESMYRPFTRKFLYLAPGVVDRPGGGRAFFPSEHNNWAIAVPGVGNRKGFGCLAARSPLSLDLAFEKVQLCPFFVYDEHGTASENIPDVALNQFREWYDEEITKWDIFWYVYAILHHPTYRTRYEASLKRELPRIPYVPDFWAFAKAGRRLAEIHVDYEKQDEYPLERIENPDVTLNWRVEKMRLNKQRDQIIYNDFLTLGGIPAEVFEYKLGGRSALEWVIDQYQISTDKRSGIMSDPNRLDDPEYIVRLIGQVITISLETVRIVRGLPPIEEGGQSAAEALTARSEVDEDESHRDPPETTAKKENSTSVSAPKSTKASGRSRKG